MTGYVEGTLAPGENYRYRGHFCWLYDLASWFWLFLGFVPVGIAIYVMSQQSLRASDFTSFLQMIALVSVVLSIAQCIIRYVHKWTTVIAITDMRVIYKTGLISRDTHEIALDKIEETLLQQSFLGRIFNYGVITIRGTGVAVIDLPVLGDLIRLRLEVEAAVADFHHFQQNNSQILPVE